MDDITLIAKLVLNPHLITLVIDGQGIESAGLEITLHRFEGVLVLVVLGRHANQDGVVLNVVAQETYDDVLDDSLGLCGGFLRTPDRVGLCLLVLPGGQQTLVDQLLDRVVRGRVNRIIIVV